MRSEHQTYLARALAAHQSIHLDTATALTKALEAGDALLAAQQLLARGKEWQTALAGIGIPRSTAALYMRLARNRQVIEAAGCSSIRQAQRLLSDARPSHSTSEKGGGSGPSSDGTNRGQNRDRYKDGYDTGYADGYRKGRSEGGAGAARARSNGGAPMAKADLLWLITLAHPDKHLDDKAKLKATRVTQWLNEQRSRTA